jgi:hypothetical protein
VPWGLLLSCFQKEEALRTRSPIHTSVSVFTGMGPGLCRTLPPRSSRDDIPCYRRQR